MNSVKEVPIDSTLAAQISNNSSWEGDHLGEKEQLSHPYLTDEYINSMGKPGTIEEAQQRFLSQSNPQVHQQFVNQHNQHHLQETPKSKVSDIHKILRSSAKENNKVFQRIISSNHPPGLEKTEYMNIYDDPKIYDDEFVLGKRYYIDENEAQNEQYIQENIMMDSPSATGRNIQESTHNFITPYSKNIPRSMITSAFTHNRFYETKENEMSMQHYYQPSSVKKLRTQKKKKMGKKAGRMASRPPVIREGDWLCPNQNCNNINWAKRTNCNLCGVQRPNIDKINYPRMLNKLYEVDSWSCSNCSNIIKGEHKFCCICGCERSQEIEEQMMKAKERRLASGGKQSNIIIQVTNKKRKKKKKKKNKMSEKLKPQIYKPKQGYISG